MQTHLLYKVNFWCQEAKQLLLGPLPIFFSFFLDQEH